MLIRRSRNPYHRNTSSCHTSGSTPNTAANSSGLAKESRAVAVVNEKKDDQNIAIVTNKAPDIQYTHNIATNYNK